MLHIAVGCRNPPFQFNSLSYSFKNGIFNGRALCPQAPLCVTTSRYIELCTGIVALPEWILCQALLVKILTGRGPLTPEERSF